MIATARLDPLAYSSEDHQHIVTLYLIGWSYYLTVSVTKTGEAAFG